VHKLLIDTVQFCLSRGVGIQQSLELIDPPVNLCRANFWVLA